METIDRETLQKEIHTVLDTLDTNTYLQLLHTMARFHKYDISQQINLLLHAPKEASAVAAEGIWKRLGYSLKEGAKGIPVLSGYDPKPQLVYDVSDTSAAEENLLWKYDEVLHGDFFEACFPSVKDHGRTETKITDLVTDFILALPSAHIVTDPNDTAQVNFLVASVSHIILERMGFPARESIEQQVGGKVEEVFQKYLDAHIGQPLDILHLLEIINRQAANILNPLGNYIHGKERIENGRTIESDRRTGGMVSRGNRELPKALPDDRKAEAMEGNRGEREGGRIPAEIRGGVRTEVSAADQRPDGETRRDGGTAQSKLAGIRPAGDGGSFPSMGTHAGGNSVVTSTEVSLFDTEDNQNAKEPQQDTAAPSRGKKNAVPEIVHKIIARELSFEEAVQAIGRRAEEDSQDEPVNPQPKKKWIDLFEDLPQERKYTIMQEGKELANALENIKKSTKGDQLNYGKIRICTTPDIFKELGYHAESFEVSAKTLLEVSRPIDYEYPADKPQPGAKGGPHHPHGINKDILQKIPMELCRPLCIMDNIKYPGKLSVVLDIDTESMSDNTKNRYPAKVFLSLIMDKPSAFKKKGGEPILIHFASTVINRRNEGIREEIAKILATDGVSIHYVSGHKERTASIRHVGVNFPTRLMANSSYLRQRIAQRYRSVNTNTENDKKQAENAYSSAGLQVSLEGRTGQPSDYSSSAAEEDVKSKSENILPIKAENNKVADPMRQDVQLEHPDDLSRNPQKSEKKQPTDIDLSAFDFSADLSSVSGKRKVFQRNMAAIRILKRLEEENREALPNELALLKSYSGFGGLPEVFDEFDKAWANEYQEIRNALTDEEFSSARASTLNAHYTPTELVRALYDAIETAGFKQGNILDPSIGSGHFIEAMPEEMRKNSHICGVDLDLLSSRLAKKIYPDVAVTNAGFEDTSYEDGSFDLAISNVPFGNYHVSSDVSLRGQHFLIHDYFIAKMIHQVRPGGLVAVITSSGTMDKANPHLRKYIAQRADLICAMRLPNTAFSSAGTKTTTDVLLLKKLDDGRIRKGEEIKSLPWMQAANYSYNPYFRDHPENVLGKLQPQRNPYGDLVTVCLPTENEDQSLSLRLFERLQAAIKESGHSYTPTKAPLPRPHQSQENTQEYRAGYQFKNGQLVYLAEDGTEGKVSLAGKNLAKATSFIKLRDAVKILLNAEEANCSDEEMKELQQELNRLFDEHLRQFGNIKTDKTLPRLAQESSDLFLLYSLEKFDKNGQYIGKEDIFFERTIRPNIVPDSTDSVEDALKISMLQKGVVDLSYMASLTKTTVNDITAQLEFTRIFYDYGTQRYQLTEEYLSGDIRKKIDDLQEIRELLQKQVRAKALAMRYAYFPNKTQIAAAYPENAFSAPEAQKHQGDPVFILDAMILGHHETLPHYTRGHKTIEYCLDEMKCLRRDTTPYQLLRREKREIALQPEDALWYRFLREKLIAFKAADQDYNVFKNIAEEWGAYQREVEKTIEKDILTADADSEVAALQKQMNRAERNLQALEDVKPCDLTAEDIKVSLGATWLDPSLVREFLQDTLQLRPYELSQLNIFYSPETGKWKIEHTATDNINVLETYGAPPSHTAFDLCDCALNFKNPVVRMTKMVDGVEKSVVNPKATARAQMQMEKLKNAFQAWLWKDPQRAQKICDTYNRKFNNIRPREYDGSFLTFPGMNPTIQLQPHQKDAIAHALFGGNTLFAHCVGAGKTFEMAATAMEAKRLGLANKSMIIVPKHLVEQTAIEFQRLYPNANILAATKKDFQQENRKKFCTRIATHNFDVVIMSYSQFEKIPLSKERKEALLQEQIAMITEAIQKMRSERSGSGTDRFSIKQMEKMRKELQANFQKLQEENQDDVIAFETLGIDRLFVDEAHYFKNLFTPTKMTNVAGISNAAAKKSTDLFDKCQYINEKTNYRGIVFATGTPVSNSMTELFNFSRYLRPDRLEEKGLSFFDAWASTFGQTINSFELKPEGKGFQNKTRFAKFYNLPELMSLTKEFMDVKTPDMLNLPVPNFEVIVETVPPSKQQKTMINHLVERAEAVRSGSVDAETDNMLNITNEGRKIALGVRVMDAALPDHPDSKLNRCVRNAVKIYQETREQQSTQLIFCDSSTPKKGAFNVYDDIKKKLITQGVKKEEIAFIHDAATDEQKEALFEKVRQGTIRILLGSTDKLGVGTNVQDKLIASHDLDVPWRPSDLEQRRGRIVRRGNENPNVKIYRYVTQGTFDAYMWQIIENKQRFISQIITSKAPLREAMDADEVVLEFGEMKAAAMDDPLIKEKLELDNQIAKISIEKQMHEEKQDKYRYLLQRVYPAQQEEQQKQAAILKDELAYVEAHTDRENGKEKFQMEVNGKVYTDVKSSFEAIQEKIAEKEPQSVEGNFKGCHLRLSYDAEEGKFILSIYHKINYRVPLSEHFQSLSVGLNQLEKSLQKRLEDTEKMMQDIAHNRETATAELAKPFEKEELLCSMRSRSEEIFRAIEEKAAEKPQEEMLIIPEADMAVAR